MKNKIYKIGLLVFAAAVMQSCFVAKKYERPELKTEDLYRTEVVSADSTSLANVSWDKIFTDPILQDYIKKDCRTIWISVLRCRTLQPQKRQ